MNNSKTNWNYLLIIIILASIVGGGILIYQYRLSQEELELPEVEKGPFLKEEYIEIPLDELKEGRNEIKGVIIEKIKPELLCDTRDLKGFEKEFIGDTYKGIQKEEGWHELACIIEDKAKVKIIGFEWNIEEEINVVNFIVIDKNNNVLYEQYKENEGLELNIEKAQIQIFYYNNKIYFLICDNVYLPKTIITTYFLYVIDREENVKLISSWGCNKYETLCSLNCGIRYKNNLYLKIGDEIWELDEGDVLKNKFPANKIKIQNDKIYFE